MAAPAPCAVANKASTRELKLDLAALREPCPPGWQAGSPRLYDEVQKRDGSRRLPGRRHGCPAPRVCPLCMARLGRSAGSCSGITVIRLAVPALRRHFPEPGPARRVRGTLGPAARPLSRRPSRPIFPGTPPSLSLSRPCTSSPSPQMTLPPRGTAGLSSLSSRKRRLKPAGESPRPSSHVGPQRLRNGIAPVQFVVSDLLGVAFPEWDRPPQHHSGHYVIPKLDR